MADCGCTGLALETCPPYLSAKTFAQFLEENCDCQGLTFTPQYSKITTTFGSTGFTVNVNNLLAFTSGNSVENADEIGLTFASNSINLPSNGLYSVQFQIQLSYGTATALNIEYSIYVNGAAATQPIVGTAHYNGANPSASSAARYFQINATRRFAANDKLRLNVLSGGTITSNPFNAWVEIIKLSN